ncbi:MAG: nickel pincer cofactor biosynthesis protein LarC [bacterium]|nr:nickel pincer cofactor biosynthesis protein LarC [bacterium]
MSHQTHPTQTHDHGAVPPIPEASQQDPAAGLDLELGSELLWLDPFGGMAGDMFLAGLLDLGDVRFDLACLQELAQDLLPGEARLSMSQVLRQGLAGRHLEVRTPESDTAPHRGLKTLLERIGASTVLNPRSKELAGMVLVRLAQAEGRVHGMAPDQVHFHEVGAVDTLIDVCGAALAMQRLNIGRLFVSPPLLGSGTVTCAHGVLPVPPPATAELLRGIPVRPGGGGGERVTPTGAALIAAWGTMVSGPGVGVLRCIGYGAGTRDPKRDQGPANLLRVMAGESAAPVVATIWQMQVNLDDMTGEDLGHCVAALRGVGALDVWTGSIDMKKDRPGTLLSVLVPADLRRTVEDLVFRHTSTFGVRWTVVERTECERSWKTLEVEGLKVRVKLRQRPGVEGGAPQSDACDVFPEYGDLHPLAAFWKVPLWEARRRVIGLYLEGPSY